MSFKAKPLTDEQKREVKKLYVLGCCSREIAMILKVEYRQVLYYLKARGLKPNKGRRVNVLKKQMKEKEMPPSYASPVTVRVDPQEAERLVSELGIGKPICKLSEAPRALNLGGRVIGSAYYRTKAAVR